MPGPVRTQVSGHMEVSVSDCQYPRLGLLKSCAKNLSARRLIILPHQ